MFLVCVFSVDADGAHRWHGDGRGQWVRVGADGSANKDGLSALLVPLHLHAHGHGAGPEDLAYGGACVHATLRRGDANGHGLH